MPREVESHDLNVAPQARAEAEPLGAYDSLPVAVVTVDGERRVLVVNRAAERLLGWSKVELRGQSLDLLLVAHQNGERAPLALVNGNGQSTAEGAPPLLAIGLRKDGSRFAAEVECARETADGAPTFTLVLRDLSAERVQEVSGSRREEFLAGALEVAQVGGWDWDVQTDQIDLSLAFHRLHGRRPTRGPQSLSLLISYYHPDDRARLAARIEKSMLRGSGAESGDYRALLFNGSTRTHRISWKVSFDTAGAPARVIGTCQDVSTRNEVEERLRRSESDLNDAQRMAGMGSFERDLVANKARWSAPLYEIYGETAESFDAESLEQYQQFVHPDDRELFWQSVQGPMAAGGGPFDGKYRIIRRDGTQRMVHVRGVILGDENKRPISMRGITQDITVQEELAAELRKRDQQLEMAESTIENAVDAINLIHFDGRIAKANQAACKMLGYTRDELVGMSIFDIDPDFPTTDWAGQWVDVRMRGSVTLETAMRRKSGELVPVELTVNHLVFEGVEYMASVLRDISERQRIQRELRASHRHYQDLFNDAPEGVVRTRIDTGIIIDVNPAFARIVGYDSPEELRGKRAEVLYASERASMIAGGRDGLLAPVNAIWRKKSGELITVEISGREILDESGVPNFYQGFVRDVTDALARAARERLLLEHKEQLELVIEGTRLGFWDWNPMTGHVAFSDRIAEMLGYRHGELASHIETARNLTHPEDYEIGAELMRLHLRGDRPHFEFVERMRHKDGRWLYILNRGKVFARDENGRPTRVCGTHTDITTEKEAETSAIEANRAKTHFLANMSHELRTPLNAVLGLSEALLDGTYRTQPDKQERSLQIIHDSGRHLLSLINDVLDIARIEAGKVTIELEDVELQSLVRKCIAYVIEMAGAKRQQIVVEPGWEALVVRADRRKLKQVIINLMTNAIKYSQEEATIRIGAHAIGPGRGGEFWVADNGPGIPLADRRRIFEPFVRLDETFAKGVPGTGLGLALVKRVIELHGGSVRVEGDVGDGTRFVVALPGKKGESGPILSALPETSARDERSSRVQAAGHSPLILLAENNEANLFTIGGYLEEHGYRVQAVRDGVAAVAAALGEDVALILMDVELPGMDGLSAMKLIRAAEQGAARPILALTAHSMPGDEQRCLAAGATAFRSKPVELKALAATIGELLGSGKKND